MSIMVFPNRRFFLLLALAESAQVGLIQIRKPQVVRSIRIAGSIRHTRQSPQHVWARIPVG
jgi:hypothetical protein